MLRPDLRGRLWEGLRQKILHIKIRYIVTCPSNSITSYCSIGSQMEITVIGIKTILEKRKNGRPRASHRLHLLGQLQDGALAQGQQRRPRIRCKLSTLCALNKPFRESLVLIGSNSMGSFTENTFEETFQCGVTSLSV